MNEFEPLVSILTARQRRVAVVLPEMPTDEELFRDFTLRPRDITEVRRCRGPDNQVGFAVQLCAVRTYGRFLSDLAFGEQWNREVR